MRINKYLPFAFIYFFINPLGLPFGLTYTAILSPLFYVWIVVTRKQEVMWPFALVMLPMALIHFGLGVDAKSYLISVLNITTVYIFCQTVYTYLKTENNTESLFKPLLITNFILCILAIPLFFTPYYHLLWSKQFLTTGVYDFKRLSLFTYEPSYYALIFTPLFAFFFLQVIFRQNTLRTGWLLVMLFLPYILSFSMGVISTLVIAGVVVSGVYFKTLIHNKQVVKVLAAAGIGGIAVLLVALIFFPNNILFVRMANVFNGKDPSARGRTFEAFWLAGELLKQKSYWWGVGPGQIKVLGFDLIRHFYGYGTDTLRVAIPNAAAETLAIFGWVGLVVRIGAQWCLFFYTKVWGNYYRLLLFVFVFIYQFTGSFITNVAEYVIWILAFAGTFPQFEVANVKKATRQKTRQPGKKA